ncbi:nuclear transport factor 2 family protein [Telluribacter sp. SYSU D00476]|uniref:nuclear transport factor 2 family protein n=1 Tax=Telluribacter sp. SYSU D00476 TaxID=2811430 RepID=UPI001FF14952|nr:nuclear transport factor 2 family protein [Telluribacter sp. SYSU D00476]
MKSREEIIRNYVEGYNQYDVDRMVADFDEAVIFRNISDGETTLLLTGLPAFREQAVQATTYFSTRTQTILAFRHQDDQTEVAIDYYGIVNMDFPNGLKKGDTISLKGTSVFTFSGNKVVQLTDVS